MSNSTAVPAPLAVNNINVEATSGEQTSIQLQVLLICVPIVLAPLVGLVSWYVRGHYEKQAKNLEHHKDEKRKYTIARIERQLGEFYWPFYLQLLSFRNLAARYKAFMAGHFSLSSTGETPMNDLRNNPSLVVPVLGPESGPLGGGGPGPNINIEMIELPIGKEKETIDPAPGLITNAAVETLLDAATGADETRSDSSRQKDIPQEIQPITKGGGLGLKGSIQIISKFNRVIANYENKMAEALKEAQKIYTKLAPIAEPGLDFLNELMKLDEYVTYVTSFRDLSDSDSNGAFFEEKISRAKFPEELFAIVESQLHYLQSVYNDLVFNHNSSILDVNYNPITQPTPNRTRVKTRRLSAYRANMMTATQSVPSSGVAIASSDDVRIDIADEDHVKQT